MHICEVNTVELEGSRVNLRGVVLEAETLKHVVDCQKFLHVEPLAAACVSNDMGQVGHDGLDQ